MAHNQIKYKPKKQTPMEKKGTCGTTEGAVPGKKNKQRSSYNTSQARAGIEFSQAGGAGTVNEGTMNAYGLHRGRRQLTGIFVTGWGHRFFLSASSNGL
jgi:hypothetical protein